MTRVETRLAGKDSDDGEGKQGRKEGGREIEKWKEMLKVCMCCFTSGMKS